MVLGNSFNTSEVCFRIHGNLIDFLPKKSRNSIIYSIKSSTSVKDAIESIVIPHVEIGGLLKDHEPLSFSYHLKSGDTIDIFPHSALSDTFNKSQITLAPSGPKRFILDVHLGSLTRLLRLTGFDTLYEKDALDVDIARIAAAEKRIVLTRNIDFEA
jgi:hypothetical protein